MGVKTIHTIQTSLNCITWSKKKPDLKSCILDEPIYMKFWEKWNYRYRKQVNGYHKFEAGQGVGYKGIRGIFWGDGTVIYLYDSGGHTKKTTPKNTKLCICQNHKLFTKIGKFYWM